MRVDGNGGGAPNYFPNSFDNIVADPSYKEPAWELESNVADWYDRNAPGDDDHFTQPGNLFRLMTDEAKKNTISNIVGAMSGIDGPKRLDIINRQLCHWFRADPQLGAGIAIGLGVDVSAMMPKTEASN
ncbi:Catalase [compost metagenome]